MVREKCQLFAPLACGSRSIDYTVFDAQAGMAKAEAKGSELRHAYMFWLPLTAVLREGIETVIFLAGATGDYEVR